MQSLEKDNLTISERVCSSCDQVASVGSLEHCKSRQQDDPARNVIGNMQYQDWFRGCIYAIDSTAWNRSCYTIITFTDRPIGLIDKNPRKETAVMMLKPTAANANETQASMESKSFAEKRSPTGGDPTRTPASKCLS